MALGSITRQGQSSVQRRLDRLQGEGVGRSMSAAVSRPRWMVASHCQTQTARVSLRFAGETLTREVEGIREQVGNAFANRAADRACAVCVAVETARGS